MSDADVSSQDDPGELTMADVMNALTKGEEENRVVEVALVHYPDDSQLRDEKHFLVVADTNTEAAERAYDLADEDYPHWSDADARICGSHLVDSESAVEQDLPEVLQRNGIVIGPEVPNNGV